MPEVWGHEHLDCGCDAKLGGPEVVQEFHAVLGKQLSAENLDQGEGHQVDHLYHESPDLRIEGKQVLVLPGLVEVPGDDLVVEHGAMVPLDVAMEGHVAGQLNDLEGCQDHWIHLLNHCVLDGIESIVVEKDLLWRTMVCH